ncbi:MAG TPA: hypothetical protein VH478_23680 [Trebonia sp.]|nr:hypothetical protein [Trebonia sp.]
MLDDIAARDLGEVPAIVEGPQLLPAFAGPPAPGWGTWLLPGTGRARRVREERLARQEALGGRPAGGRSRAQRLLQRDALLTERIRAAAARPGRPVIEVPPAPDWPAIAAAAESALAPARRSAPRLAPGRELRQQRRHESRAAGRQVRLWMGDAGLTAAPAYPFGRECGHGGCHATWTAAPDAYAARTAAGRPLIAPDPPA